jgi:hypothetical protein
MRVTTRNTLLAYLVGGLIILPMLIPVLNNIEEGKRMVELGILSPSDRLHPVGLGPVSGLMIYLFMTPVLVALPRTLWGKMAVIMAMLALSQIVSFIMSVYERGETALGLSLTWFLLVVLCVAAVMAWRHQRTRQEDAQEKARVLARIARETASGGSTAETVQKLILGAIWQSSVEESPDTLDHQLRQALVSIRSDLADNPSLDPEGQGVRMVDRFLAKAEPHLKRSRPGRGRETRTEQSRPASHRAPRDKA